MASAIYYGVTFAGALSGILFLLAAIARPAPVAGTVTPGRILAHRRISRAALGLLAFTAALTIFAYVVGIETYR